MGLKLRYEVDLTRPVRTVPLDGHELRPATPADLLGLARLMLDAYVGTIDYEGEDLDDAIGEVRSYLENGHPLLDRSYVVESEGAIVSAVLVSLSEGIPFIGYVMTAPDCTAHSSTATSPTISVALSKTALRVRASTPTNTHCRQWSTHRPEHVARWMK